MGVLSGLFGKQVPGLNALELGKKLMDPAQPFLLDVREPQEFREGHIAGARLIPLGELRRRLDEVPAGREVVCICATGQRSIPAAQLLIASGYAASSLENGMMAWQMAGFPVETDLPA